MDFADGKVRLVGVRARQGGLLVRPNKLRELREHLRRSMRGGAIYRRPRIRPDAIP